MQVYINKYVEDPTTHEQVLVKERELVEAQLICMNIKTVWVKLPDGRIIKRKLNRDVVPGPVGPTK